MDVVVVVVVVVVIVVIVAVVDISYLFLCSSICLYVCKQF